MDSSLVGLASRKHKYYYSFLDAVAIHYIGRVEGDGIIAMLRDVELEGLLLQVAEAVGGHIADVDGRRVGLLGNAHAARAFLDVQLHGRELGLVPVAYLVFQRVVAGSQRERRAAVAESILGPALACLALDIAEIKAIVQATRRAGEL